MPCLDGWRGLAIIGVLVDHYITSRGINLGRFGVEMFFVLSGRLMAEILFVRATPIKTFLWRRFARIYPVLIIFASAMFLLGAITSLVNVPPASYVSSITLTSNYAPLFGVRTEILDHVWSLCVEVHIYILLAIIAALNQWKKFPVAWVVAMLAVLFVINGALQTWLYDRSYYYFVYWRSDVRGASILISAACYLFYRDAKRNPAILRYSGLPMILAVLAFAFNFNVVPDPIKYSLGSVLLALSLTLLPQVPASGSNWYVKVLEHPFLRYMGVWSYSIYLWGQPFSILSRNTPGYFMKILTFLLMLLCSLASFYLIEQPARRAINRLRR